MPAHRWVEETKLQFEQAPGGEWGPAVQLKGERGRAGRDGGGGGRPRRFSGVATATARR